MILDDLDIWLIQTFLKTKYYQNIFKSFQEVLNAHQKVLDYTFTFHYSLENQGNYVYNYAKKELLGKFHRKDIPLNHVADFELMKILNWREFYLHLFDKIKQIREFANNSRDTFFTLQLPNNFQPHLKIRVRNYNYKEVLQLYLTMMGGSYESSRNNSNTIWTILANKLCLNEAPLCVFLYQNDATQKEMLCIGLTKKLLFGIQNLSFLEYFKNKNIDENIIQCIFYIQNQVTLNGKNTDQEIEYKLVFLLRWFIFITFLFFMDQKTNWKKSEFSPSFLKRIWSLIGEDSNQLPDEIKFDVEKALSEAKKRDHERGKQQNNYFGIQNISIVHIFKKMFVIDPDDEIHHYSFWKIWEANERYWQNYLMKLHKDKYIDYDLINESQWALTLYNIANGNTNYPTEHLNWLCYF